MGTTLPATTFTPLTETDAREVVAWRYPPPYDCYDSPPWDDVVEQGWAIGDPVKRATEFSALRSRAGELLGFLRLRLVGEPQVVLLSCGLRPDRCGHGLGQLLVAHAVERSAAEHPGAALALDVRPFNARAIRLYTNRGFVPQPGPEHPPTGRKPLLRMVRVARPVDGAE